MGRRNAGEGSIYQRKDGSWVAQYRGQYRYAKDRNTVKQKLYKMLTDTQQAKPKTITVCKALDQYLEAAESNLKPRTVTRYGVAIQVHLKPAFGSVKLHELEAARIEEVYARKLKEGLSPSTIQLINAVLSSALKRAVRLKLVEHNVCKDVQTPRIEREEVEVFGPEEVQAILSAASGNRMEALWVLAMTTGLRVSEVTGLQVQDYDAVQGTLAIRRSVYNGSVGTPKSKRGRRTIKLPQRAQNALSRHTSGTTWMFANSKDNPLCYSTFVDFHWKPLLERAGVPYRNFHTCRHYVSSTLLSKGLPITAVARFMGHDEQTLLKTYSHLMPNMMDAVAAAIDDALG